MHKRKILQEIDVAESLKSVAQAYQETSIIKMQRTRNSVLKSRDFLSGISDIFFDVKASYKKQLEELMKLRKKQDPSKISILPTNGKTLVLLLSANAKLYGDIVAKTFTFFHQYIQGSDADIIVVGKLGKDLYEQQKIEKPYTYFEFSDSNQKFEDLKDLVTLMLQYQKVLVFHGKFINVMNQVPVSSDISGEETQQENQTTTNSSFKFLFEPELDRILTFFQTQIFTSLFQQTIQESELARYASRIRAMEDALEHINKRINTFKLAKKRSQRLIMNKKQIESLAGISLWNSR